MDNICHTLVGAALGEAGLKRRTRLGAATLMIASNLPDLDVLVFATGASPVAFRRGWTHGLLAQLLLPALLAGVMAVVSRRRSGASDTDPAGSRVSVPWLLALSYLGVLLHVGFDYLNNYGVRVLAPFDWRWFYGDAVFIVDLWLWLALGAGVVIARRRGRSRAALASLVFAGCYAGLMLGSTRAARPIVAEAWRVGRGVEPRSLMVGPVVLTPFRREVIVDAGDHYETGIFEWPSARVTFDARRVPKNDAAPATAQARRAPSVRGFLVWSRFPYWEVRSVPGGTRVTVKDMRFGDRLSASTVVTPGAP